MELIERVPFGWMACRLNGEQVTVTGVSDQNIRLRLDQEAAPISLELRFLRLREACWTRIVPDEWHMISCKQSRLGYDALFAVEDPAYRAEVFRALREYAAYIRLKAREDDSALSLELTGCPTEGDTSPTFDAQKRLWFENTHEIEPACDYTLALSLDRPDAYERFLFMPFPEFQEDYFRRSHLERHPLFRRKAERVYIGNACCFHLFPRNLLPLIKRCEAQHLPATVVLPPVRESCLSDFAGISEIVQKSCADEVAVNDWGMLTLLKDSGKSVLLGTQLNRRRKDPRIRQKIGFERDQSLLMENSLNDPVFSRHLALFHVNRYEYESCMMPVRVAPGKHSLHLPFFQTNTSHACPLASTWEGVDPGLPRNGKTCPMPCISHALLYPDHLGAVGRYNSIFGLDQQILSDEAALRHWLDQGIDRVVAELL